MRALAFVATLGLFAAACSSSSSSTAPTSSSSNDAGVTMDGATTGAETTPESTAIAARCLEGGAGDTKDGWVRTIGADSVTALNGNVGVSIVYSMTIDDELRAARHFAEGVWDRLLGAEYTVSGTRTAGGDDFGQLAYASATAVEKATGTTFFMTVVAPRDNGVTYPVIALAPDEATLTAKLATPDAIGAMRAYNAFSLSCSSILGKWTTDSLNAVATYDRAGSFTGILVSALQIDVAFASGSHYDWHAKVTDNTGVVSEDESGGYTATDQSIDLHSDAGKTTGYDAAFVAVKGGISLSITNREFSGNRWVLYRTK